MNNEGVLTGRISLGNTRIIGILVLTGNEKLTNIQKILKPMEKKSTKQRKKPFIVLYKTLLKGR